jgi:hypothetical protein
MGITSLAGSVGVSTAGALAVPFHQYLCSLPIIHRTNKWWMKGFSFIRKFYCQFFLISNDKRQIDFHFIYFHNTEILSYRKSLSKVIKMRDKNIPVERELLKTIWVGQCKRWFRWTSANKIENWTRQRRLWQRRQFLYSKAACEPPARKTKHNIFLCVEPKTKC